MSKKLFAFLLNELKIARVICPKCGAVTEVNIEQLSYRLNSLQCPVCRADWGGLRLSDGGDNHIARLAKAIKALQDSADAPKVEFVLPDESE